jgi:hypothetical protein
MTRSDKSLQQKGRQYRVRLKPGGRASHFAEAPGWQASFHAFRSASGHS